VLLAGATGIVGRRLVPELLAAGHEVAGTTRTEDGASRVRAAGARALVVDAFDREGLRRALRAERPDAVIHQLTDLARFDREANARLRVEGTRNLVDAALAAGVRVMVAQSVAFAYAPGPGPAGEGEPLDWESAPGRRRTVQGVAALERAVGEMERGVVLRYGALYGPGTFYGPGGSYAESIRRGTYPATTGITSFLHPDDAARAALLALHWPPGAVNVVDDEPAAGTEWVPTLAGLLGGPPPPQGGPGSPAERGASNARARGELGWRPLHPSWRTGFARALGGPGRAG
jgi:nucleoside-diphosphate-sugar epimerase